MNQTILALCQSQQWDALFQTLSDLTFLEAVSKTDIPSLAETIRHALYLAEIHLPSTSGGTELADEQNAASNGVSDARRPKLPHHLKNLEWKHPCGEELGCGYLLRLSDILWSFSTSDEKSLFFPLYFGVTSEYPLLAKHWASQHKEPWLRRLNPTSTTERKPLAVLGYGARVTPDGACIVVWQDGAFSLFSLKEERFLLTIYERAQAYFDEGRLLLARARDGGFRVYETQTGALRYTLPGSPEDPARWYLSENKFLLLGETSLLTSDGEHTRRWNIDTGELLYQIKGQLSPYHGKVTTGEHFLVLTPGEARANKSIRLLSTGEEVLCFKGDKSAVLSSDGRWLAMEDGYNDALVYDVPTGALRYTFKGSDSISSIEFSDDSQFLYTWRSGEQIDITDVPEDVASEWSLETGEKTTSNKSFPSRPPAPCIEGWSWGYRQLKGPDNKVIELPQDMMLYHMVDGRHYLAGVMQEAFFVYEVCNSSSF